MKTKITRLSLSGCLLLALTTPGVNAGKCDAYFPFDGNLTDASGSGHDGQMIDADEGSPAPTFVTGKHGSALQLDSDSAMRSPLSLHYDTCAKVTISAWVRATDDFADTSQDIVSSGGSFGPGLRTSGGSLVARGPSNGLRRRDVLEANSDWTVSYTHLRAHET